VKWFESYTLNGRAMEQDEITPPGVSDSIIDCLLVSSNDGYWDVVEHRDGYIKLVWVDTSLVNHKTQAAWEFRRE
jgi:hypothetical protein